MADKDWKRMKKMCVLKAQSARTESQHTLKGSISLFSALTFFLILALLFGLLESSRVYGLYANAYGKSELGVVSAYSNYAAEIADEFGVMLFWEDGGTIEDMLLACVEKQTQGEDNLILSLSSPEVDLDEKIYITEEGGIYFLRQIAELVPYRVSGEVINDILSLSDIQSQMSVINDFTQMIENAQDNFAEIGEALDSVKKLVSSIRSLKSAIEETMDSIKTAALSVESFVEDSADLFQSLQELWEEAEEDGETDGESEETAEGGDVTETGNDSQSESNGTLEESSSTSEESSGTSEEGNSTPEENGDTLEESIEALYTRLEESWNAVRDPYEESRETLLQLAESAQTSLEAAGNSMETFESLQETAAEALENMEELLESYRDVIPSAMYSELLSQVQTMKETFTITDQDTYGRAELKKAIAGAKELADKLVEKIEACEMPEFSEVAEKLRKQGQEEAEQYLKNLVQEAQSSLKEAVLEFTEKISGITFQEAESGSSDSETKGLTAGILESITALASDGIYSLVLEDASQISTLTTSLTELPSMTSKTTGTDQKTFLKSTWNRALMAAYSKLYFGNYLDPAEDGAIAYEMEYVLGGSAGDRSNLTTVMGEIFLIREGLNYAYLLTDSGKMQEAGAVALAIATAAGLPILKIPIQLLLLAAWAAAESVCDLQQLYRGGSVPMVKTADSWNMSLENLADVASGTILAGTSKGTEAAENGYLSFDYETYLLILLLLQNGETQTYRMMDVIQMRMQKSVRSDFYIKNCVVYTKGTISYRSAALFSDTWVLQQLLPASSDYTISTSFSYGYVES